MAEISIIMGVYNAAEKMDAAIESIRAQTFTDWEFIICDDGSSDDTYSKLLKWNSTDKRILPLKNEFNSGLAATLNHCIEYTKGNYIARMDDDDYSFPNRFENQLDFLESNSEYSFCSSTVLLYDGVNTYIPQNKKKEKPKAQDFLIHTCFIHPATMFRREALIKAGGYRVARETTRTEDYDLFMRMYAQGMIGYNIQTPLLRYFVSLESMQKKRKYRHRIDEAIVRYKGFKNLGLLPKGIPYILKPLIIGILPKKILLKYKSRKNKLMKIKNAERKDLI